MALSRTSTTLWLFMALELTAVVLWLPSILWPITFSWDESTFYLVAQSLLQGELPYTTTFENKSPLGLVFQSVAIAVVGTSPTGMRLIAALILGATAFLLVSSAPTCKRFIPAYVVGALFLLAWVNFTNGLAWMSEINVVFVFALAWFLITSRRSQGVMGNVLLGVVIGSLPLVRVNWAFVAAILFIAAWLWNRNLKTFIYLLLGALLPTTITVGLYVTVGALPRLWAGMVELPRGLGESEGWGFPNLGNDQLPLYWLALIGLVTALGLTAIRVQQIRGDAYDRVDLLVLVTAWALTVGAFIQPYDFPYQTLQILPLAIISIGRIIQLSGPFTFATLIPIGITSLALAYLMWVNALTTFDWRNTSREETELVSFVGSIPNFKDKSLWVPDTNNFLYWRLKKPSIIPLASQPYLLWEPGAQRADLGFEMSEGEASQFVFDMNPDLIVANSDFKGSYNETPEAAEVWQKNLNQRYRPIAEINGRTIWELAD